MSIAGSSTQVSAAPELNCGPNGKPALNGTACIDRTPVSITKKCPSARRAVNYYARRLTQWRVRMGAGAAGPERHLRYATPCPRYLAHVLQRKARAAHRRYDSWYFNEYRWDHWLPAKYYRVARCETGVDFHFDSGTYVSAFGIIRVAYESMHHWTGNNTPREQYEVASSIQRKYGWGAWGCGGA